MTHNRSVLKLENTEARRGLRQLLKEVQLDDKLKSDPSRLYQRMVESDQFLDSVNDAGTGKVDAVLYHHLSRLSRKQAEAIDTNKVKFVASDFAHKLANHVGGTIEEGGIQGPKGAWTRFGRYCNDRFFRSSPFLSFLNGTLDKTECKEGKKIAHRRIHDRSWIYCPATKVKKLSKGSRSDERTDFLVHSIEQQLLREYKKNGRKPVGLFQFALHPASFGRSVENIFHIGFLVKENKVTFSWKGPGEEPVLIPRVAQKDPKGQGTPKTDQVMFSLNMKDWSDLVEALEIKVPKIQMEGDSGDQDMAKKKLRPLRSEEIDNQAC